MNIIKIMIPKINVAYVHADDSMRQGLEKMRSHGYTTVPVISKEGVCVGTVSEGDYLWYMVENGFPDMRRLEEVGISAIINTTRNPAVTIDVSPIELYSRITEARGALVFPRQALGVHRRRRCRRLTRNFFAAELTS